MGLVKLAWIACLLFLSFESSLADVAATNLISDAADIGENSPIEAVLSEFGLTQLGREALVDIPCIRETENPNWLSILTFLILLLMTASPTRVLDIFDQINRLYLHIGVNEPSINLDALPKSVSEWPEWQNVHFQHVGNAAHTLPKHVFAKILREHLLAQGMNLSKKDTMEMVDMLPPKAFVSAEVFRILNRVLAHRMLRGSIKMRNLDWLAIKTVRPTTKTQTSERKPLLAIDLRNEVQAIDPRIPTLISNMFIENSVTVLEGDQARQLEVASRIISSRIENRDSPCQTLETSTEKAECLFVEAQVIKSLGKGTSETPEAYNQFLERVVGLLMSFSERIRMRFKESEPEVPTYQDFKEAAADVSGSESLYYTKLVNFIRLVGSIFLVLQVVNMIRPRITADSQTFVSCDPETYRPPQPAIARVNGNTVDLVWDPPQCSSVSAFVISVEPSDGLDIVRTGPTSTELYGLKKGVQYHVALNAVWDKTYRMGWEARGPIVNISV